LEHFKQEQHCSEALLYSQAETVVVVRALAEMVLLVAVAVLAASEVYRDQILLQLYKALEQLLQVNFPAALISTAAVAETVMEALVV
jgi:hypothetical protein